MIGAGRKRVDGGTRNFMSDKNYIQGGFGGRVQAEPMDPLLHPIARRAGIRSAWLLACLLQAQAAAAGPHGPLDAHGLLEEVEAPALAAGPYAVSREPAASPNERPEHLRLRNTLIIGSGATLVAAYGLSKWWQSGFGGGFKTTNEGWLGRNTEYGGADKLGHMYFNYSAVRLLTPLFEAAGNGRDASVSLAAWTAVGILTGVEVADGFSRRWRFSPQDAAMNVAGMLLGVVLETHPELDEKFDFRLAYRPSKDSDFNPFSDYSGQRYLLVVKADGFAPLRNNRFLRYLEVAVGYGARGFEGGGERRRDIYVGVSLNLSRLLADGVYEGRMHSTPFQRGTDRVFELVQFPTIGYARRSLD